ncbi:MAG TPA: GNAT family N-acetyltransferase [Actinomycetes bacterium]|jgi:ribosomal protein S18 acetylase RimI-like enzyme|nr:GNAT family N-acetyltransferase [Actinomycetes bacterium]
MTSRSSRAYAGVGDLRRMQAAVAGAFASTSLRVGDLAWLARDHTHRELALDIRIWEGDEGRLLGWTFYRSNGGFLVFVAPGCGDDALVDEMLAVIDEAARTSVAAGDAPVSLHTYGIDTVRSAEDRLLAAALRRRGFEADRSGGVLSRRLDHQLREPTLPRGYRLAAVRTSEQVVGRVTAQRAAFAPSGLTLERYERVRRTWPYRPDLDRIVTTAAGVVVAFCTAWIDEENAAGLLEPVGTHPAHQRRGLGKAVCLDALRALRDAGARTAQVAYESDAAHALYRAVGFERGWQELVFRRDLQRTPSRPHGLAG